MMLNRVLFRSLLVLMFALSLTAAPFVSAQSNPPDPRKGIERVIDEAFNQGQFDVIDELFAEDYVSHPDGGGRDAFKVNIIAQRDAMPDLHASADLITVEGDWAAFRFTQDGTFRNPLVSLAGTVPPTGKPFHLSGNIMIHFGPDGKVIEEWDMFDNLTIGMQLGVIPMPEGADMGEATAVPILPDGAAGMAEANKATALAVFDAVDDGSLVTNTPDIFADDFTFIELGFPYDLETWKGVISGINSSFSDLTTRVDRIIAENNRVVVMETTSGINTGDMDMGDGSVLPATGQTVDFAAIVIFQFDDTGKIMYVWDEYDNLALLSQMGLLDMMATPEASS